MVYLIMNIVAVFFFAFFTHMLDRKVKFDNMGVSSLAIAMLLTTIEGGLFTLLLIMRHFLLDALTVGIMKVVFSLDAIAFTTLCFGLINIAAPKKHTIVTLLKFGLYLFGILLVFLKFSSVEVTNEHGIVIISEYLFDGDARMFFPWTWVTLYTSFFRYILPIISLTFLFVFQENTATQLEKYQSTVFVEAFILMWLINGAVTYVSISQPAFSLLFMYGYLFLYVAIYIGLTKTVVPSGKATFVTAFKTLVSYIIPAVIVGFVCMITQPQNNNYKFPFLAIYGIVAIGVLHISLWISNFLNSSTKLYTADYGAALEQDLAKIDYKDVEMDQVTTRMYDIFRKNVESSSLTVYILTGQNELEVAYSSNNMTNKVSLANPIFDNLLNIGRSIVVRTQLEKEHDLAVVQEGMETFFEETKSDAVFILNEGHNIFGLITLGKKVSGDPYKEYDYNVFIKLYSYFFVFGYYMRNISNKDIMGIVNREIRMSSQIITSIQENLDHVNNPKVDIGYMMVPAHNIGGEFIDMIRLTNTRHLFVVGDLSGKGIAASMNMVIFKSIVRAFLAEVHDFKKLVVKLNSFVRDSLPKGTIFAGLFALVDFETDTMYYINCGVPTLMMYTQVYNNVIEIQGSGHILGFVKDITPYISVKTTKLSSGDIILACTDGLIQSHSLRGEQFGKERVQQAILDNSTYPAQRMAQFTFENLQKFISKEMEDDVSILVLKYEGLEKEADKESAVTENAEAATEPAEPKTDSQLEATASEAEIQNPVEENASTETVVENKPVVEDETPAAAEEALAETAASEATETPDAPADDGKVHIPEGDMNLPEGFEMPDLSDLDAMMKEAGL